MVFLQKRHLKIENTSFRLQPIRMEECIYLWKILSNTEQCKEDIVNKSRRADPSSLYLL